MSQGDEARIDKYIEDNYLNPQVTVSLLCSGPAECTFLDIFRQHNPDLPFLTEEDLRAVSHDYYLRNGNNLQETLVFIETELKKYYNYVFNVWIIFRFEIIQDVPDGSTDPQIIETMMINYLPGQLVNLLFYIFNSIFYDILNLKFKDSDKRSMIQKNVVDTVLLYSRLYIFLKQPDKSLPFFSFNKRNVSLTFLLNVMVYKCFDSLHKNSSVIIFENYIACLQIFFNKYISIFGDTPTDENKQKIDFGLAHLARFLLYLPNLSFILSNNEIQPVFISRQIEGEFKKIKIFFVREHDGQIKKTFTLEEVEALKKSGTDVTRFDVRRDLDFNPMSEATLSNAIEFVSAVRIKLNEKQGSSISDADEQPIIQEFKTRYLLFKDKGYDYFGFLSVLSQRLQNFVLRNSRSKEDKLILDSNFSQCCGQIPEFAIYTTQEKIKMKMLEKKRKDQQRQEAEEEKRLAERIMRLDQMKFKKEQQREKEEEKRKAQQAAAAAAAASVVAVPKELSEKEKSAFMIQRTGTFKNDIKSIFPEFSAAIQSGEYEHAATMLNEKLPPKLRENVPWTATNMEKFSPKMMQAYQELLVNEQPADTVVAVSSPVVSISPTVAPLESTPPTISKKAAAKAAAALEKQRLEEAEAVEKQRLAEAAALEAAQKRAEKKALRKQVKEATAAAAQEAAQKLAAEQAAAEQAAAEQAAAEQAAAEQAAFNEFEKNIGLLCGGNGITYFETMFHCSLPQFFRIITVVRELPDQEIIKIMSSLVPAPDSASARTGPLTSYMDLENSGRNCRALFAFALLNGIRRVENVRFSFVGRTFLQLIACHSMLPVEACETLHIPKNTSDIDVYVIFNPDQDPITLRPLFLHIFNLFWRIPPGNIHIHYSRDNASWRQFEESGNGHLYESVTRGTPDVMKVSFNNQGKVVEVSDIGFKTVQQFAGVFRLSLPPLSRDKRFETLTVNELKLLELKYTLDQEIFSFNPQYNPCVVQLDLQFPSALSGFDESINNVFKILNSLLKNQLNFDGSNPHAPIDFYFIHVSNLLKFIVRIIQYKGISEGGVNIQNLHANVNSGVRSLRVLQFEMFIADAAIDLINLFFNPNGSINDDIFRMVDEYRKTSELKETGAAERVESKRFSAFHTHILKILRRYGFLSGYLDAAYQSGFNLYGGVKQKQQRHKYTKKNRMNKKKRYSIKINKIKKIKIKQNVKKSLKYHKTNEYKVTKKH